MGARQRARRPGAGELSVVLSVVLRMFPGGVGRSVAGMAPSDATSGKGRPAGITGRVAWRDDDSYESLRQGALWNRRTPDRYPDVIVTAASEQDVVSAVRLARDNGMRIAVKSGGHNLSGACLRDGGMLLDLSALDTFSVDQEARTAEVQPALTSGRFAQELTQLGLGFPVGHCGSVPMGGYLLSGGLGWNMSQWGLACLNVEAIDVVTADASLIRASEREHPDLFWAARGAGPGFFGVVTRFHLRLHVAPGIIRSSTYLYPLADVEDVSAWARDVAPTLPPSVEMLLHLVSAPPGAPAGPAGKAVVLAATAFGDDPQTAAAALGALESCPAIGRALFRQTNQATTFSVLHDALDQRLPAGHRYIEDALWSSDDYAAVLPRLAEHFVGAPSPRSLVMAVMPPRPPDGMQLPDVAFSMRGATFALCYAIWDDADDDQRNEQWHRRLVGAIAPSIIGRYIAEADLEIDGAAEGSFAAPVWERLQALKTEFDPDNLFHTYLGQDKQEGEQQ
jgi:FAD/FMN-containing dehydrogenase